MRVESHPAKDDALIDLIVKTRSKSRVFRGKHALEMWPNREEQKKDMVENTQGGYQHLFKKKRQRQKFWQAARHMKH